MMMNTRVEWSKSNCTLKVLFSFQRSTTLKWKEIDRERKSRLRYAIWKEMLCSAFFCDISLDSAFLSSIFGLRICFRSNFDCFKAFRWAFESFSCFNFFKFCLMISASRNSQILSRHFSILSMEKWFFTPKSARNDVRIKAFQNKRTQWVRFQFSSDLKLCL